MYLHFVTHINQQNNTPPPLPTICIPVAAQGPSLIRNYRKDPLHARTVALSQHVVHYVHDQAFSIRTWQPPGEGLLYSPPEDVLGSSSVGCRFLKANCREMHYMVTTRVYHIQKTYRVWHNSLILKIRCFTLFENKRQKSVIFTQCPQGRVVFSEISTRNNQWRQLM